MLNKEYFLNYFSSGDIANVAQELKLFGIKKGDTWLKTGLSLCFTISFITVLFMYLQLKQITPNWLILQNGMCWIILFSITNSFSKEMIYRVGYHLCFKRYCRTNNHLFYFCHTFGLPHFAGTPNGIIGAILTSVLGFVLAKSMVENKWFFWAWAIHCFQDIIIFGSLYIINQNTFS